MSQGTLGRSKQYLMRLEGLFRCIDPDASRNPEGIISSVEGVLESSGGDADKLLLRLEEVAIDHVGLPKGRGKGRGKGKGGAADDGDDVNFAVQSLSWPLQMAHTISKLYVKLQHALLSDTLIKYYVEWCASPDPRVQGLCMNDIGMSFPSDGDTDIAVAYVGRSHANNIYVYIPHSLLDPVLQSAKGRVDQFFKQTYWMNGPALEATFAALSLALRGLNVDRAFWGIGPGGVGQSLRTAHFEAMLAHNHGVLDMNI